MIRKRIKRKVITGGPGSGKSNSIQCLKDDLPWVKFVPEVATILIDQMGIRPGVNLTSRRFQMAVCGIQTVLEDTAAEFATADGKEAVIFDRGVLDNAVYLDGFLNEFQELFKTTIYKEYECYDLVVCLDVPPRKIYEAQRHNNPARSENYELARKLGNLTIKAWENHYNFVLIKNEGSWEEKQAAVSKAVRDFIDGRE